MIITSVLVCVTRKKIVGGVWAVWGARVERTLIGTRLERERATSIAPSKGSWVQVLLVLLVLTASMVHKIHNTATNLLWMNQSREEEDELYFRRKVFPLQSLSLSLSLSWTHSSRETEERRKKICFFVCVRRDQRSQFISTVPQSLFFCRCRSLAKTILRHSLRGQRDEWCARSGKQTKTVR